MDRTKFYTFGRLWEITPEPSRLELSFLHATLLPNALYILTKFHENSSKGIGVMGRTRFRLQMDGRTDGRQGDRYIPRTFWSGDKNGFTGESVIGLAAARTVTHKATKTHWGDFFFDCFGLGLPNCTSTQKL